MRSALPIDLHRTGHAVTLRDRARTLEANLEARRKAALPEVDQPGCRICIWRRQKGAD